MTKVQLRPSTALSPIPAVLVSCGVAGEVQNIITIAWTGTVSSDPPSLSISVRKNRYSYDLIRNAGEFVVNIASADMVKDVDYCGTVSGRSTDKYTDRGLTAARGHVVNAPIVAECPVNIECRVTQEISLGSHQMFIGEIVNVQASKSALDDSGRIDIAKLSPLGYGGGTYWSLKEALGTYGFSQKK